MMSADNELHTGANLNFDWMKALDKSGVVNDESILCNGNILTMGTDNAFCTKSNLRAVLLRVPDRKVG